MRTYRRLCVHLAKRDRKELRSCRGKGSSPCAPSCGVEELNPCMEGFLAAWNQEPKPFVWTTTVESITEKLSRCRRTLEQIEPGCSSLWSRKRKK